MMNGVHRAKMTQSIPVVLFLEDGSYKVLGVYDTYQKADRAVDKFCDIYPNGWVDILDESLVKN
jgi:hypothetical protein